MIHLICSSAKHCKNAQALGASMVVDRAMMMRSVRRTGNNDKGGLHSQAICAGGRAWPTSQFLWKIASFSSSKTSGLRYQDEGGVLACRC